MKIILICFFFSFLKLNLSAHELDCSKTSCTYENIEIVNDYQKRQLEKKIIETMTLLLDVMQKKIIIESSK